MGKPREVSTRLPLYAILILLALTAAIYWQVSEFKFVAYDDDQYVTNNPMVASGLSVRSALAAFTSFHASNWHPLTWLSHMLDVRLHGMNAGGHHLTNLYLHLANTLLLFWLISLLTGYGWRAAFVAGLFALHPLHVESVAWVAERKDVLSTFLWLLTTLAYVRYVRVKDAPPPPKRKAREKAALPSRMSALGYPLVILLFALGLMAKPMLVSLPITLLLLDRWPLGRPEKLSKLIWEKTPLFVLAAASCVVTVIAQRSGGAVASLDTYPLWSRLANAAISYIMYLWRMVWPLNLACLYPHPGASVSIWLAVVCGVAVAAATLAAIRLRRQAPYLTFGWLWYLITLIPVIGIAQVGVQASSDRYTYVPLIGIFVAIAWGMPALCRTASSSRASVVCASVAVVVLLGLASLSYIQIGFWSDEITLYEHAVQVTGPNRIMRHNLAMAYTRISEFAKAEDQFRQAIDIEPSADDYAGLGGLLLIEGRPEEAAEACEKAVELNPKLPTAHLNLAIAYRQLGRPAEAGDEFSTALDINPRLAGAHLGLARLLVSEQRLEDAIPHFRAAAELDPGSTGAWLGLAVCLLRSSRPYEALQTLEMAVEKNPGDDQLSRALADVQSRIR